MTYVIQYTSFDTRGARSTGGATGSQQVLHGDTPFQLKPAIEDNPHLKRRKKVDDLDTENFSEFIAACICRALIGLDNIEPREAEPKSPGASSEERSPDATSEEGSGASSTELASPSSRSSSPTRSGSHGGAGISIRPLSPSPISRSRAHGGAGAATPPVADRDPPELIPRICLVYRCDETGPKAGKVRIQIASRYLKSTGGGSPPSLDEYGKHRAHSLGFRGAIRERAKGKEAFININAKAENCFAIGEKETIPRPILDISCNPTSFDRRNSILRTDLAKAIAFSSLVGDHDVNPSNMMVITHEGENRIARIDFGHAFNDLLMPTKFYAKVNGGAKRYQNWIQDFLNRETIINLNPFRQITKLWESYNGVTPSVELYTAFNDILDNHGRLGLGIDNARKSFVHIIDIIHRQPLTKVSDKNKKIIVTHILESLSRIGQNFIDKNYSIAMKSTSLRSTTPGAIISSFFEDLQAAFQIRLEEVARVQMLLHVQILINNHITNNLELVIPPDVVRISRDLKTKDGKIIWFKMRNNEPAFIGTPEEYFAHESAIRDRTSA